MLRRFAFFVGLWNVGLIFLAYYTGDALLGVVGYLLAVFCFHYWLWLVDRECR